MRGRDGLAVALAAGVLVTLLASSAAAVDRLLLGEDEIAHIISHGPWPPLRSRDPSNRVSGRPDAIALGRRLFSDARLSRTGTISCATCHQPDKGWSDGRGRAKGIGYLDRNALSILDVSGLRWYGWDGRSDSLWAHSIGPILHPLEMGANAGHVARAVGADPELSKAYRTVFGRPPDASNSEATLVDVAKALASFQETIVSGRTPFDEFRDALARGDRTAAAAHISEAAQRGAQIFFGKGRCNFCHTGPAFSNGEFADAGVPYFIAGGGVDPGRHEGIVKLRQSPFNLIGRHNDDPERNGAWAARQVASLHSNFGAFKVPTLRSLTRTAPYFHDGSKATLADVVRHYSEIDPERLHSDGERILRPLNLADGEMADLVAFLRTLSE